MQQVHRTWARDEYKKLHEEGKSLKVRKRTTWDENIVCNQITIESEDRTCRGGSTNLSKICCNIHLDTHTVKKEKEIWLPIRKSFCKHLTEEMKTLSFQEKDLMLQPPSIEEGKKAIKLKNKVPRPYNICSEFIKHGGPTLYLIHEPTRYVWDWEVNLKKSILCLVHKIGRYQNK